MADSPATPAFPGTTDRKGPRGIAPAPSRQKDQRHPFPPGRETGNKNQPYAGFPAFAGNDGCLRLDVTAIPIPATRGQHSRHTPAPPATHGPRHHRRPPGPAATSFPAKAGNPASFWFPFRIPFLHAYPPARINTPGTMPSASAYNKPRTPLPSSFASSPRWFSSP